MPVLNSLTVPLEVIRATWLLLNSTNHMSPSGPAAMPNGSLSGVIPAKNSLTVPTGVNVAPAEAPVIVAVRTTTPKATAMANDPRMGSAIALSFSRALSFRAAPRVTTFQPRRWRHRTSRITDSAA
jgi:hypothetical protein